MITIRSLLAMGSVAICGVAISGAEGCGEPGVIDTAPAPGVVKDAGAAKKDAGSKPSTSTTTGSASDGADDTDGTDSTDSTDSSDDTKPAKPDTSTKPAGKDAGGKTDPVTTSDAGTTKPDTGGKADAGGGDGTMMTSGSLPACPSGWTCSDPGKALTDMGIDGKVVDQSGMVVPAACGNGGLVMCSDPKDPKGSCPKELTNPFCAHISLGALGDFQSCAQLCDP